MGKIAVIYNPNAGKNKRSPGREKRLMRIFGKRGEWFRTDDRDALNEAVRCCRDGGYEIVAISGGDGTLHQVFSAMVNTYGDGHPLPKVAFLRSGTMNTAAKSIRLKGSAFKTLQTIVDRNEDCKPFKIFRQPLIRVNDYYGFMAGAGVVAYFLEAYYSAKNPGPVHAAAMVTRIVGSTIFRTGYSSTIFRPVRCRLVIDGKRMEHAEYVYILGCTVRELGLGFTPTPRAYERAGHFHLLAGSMTPADLVPKIPALWLGRDIVHPRMYYNGIAAEVVMEPFKEEPWMIDGDIYTTGRPLHFSAGPVVDIIMPI